MDRRTFVRTSLCAAAALSTQSIPLASVLRAAPTTRRVKPLPSGWNAEDITACWIGHSTILLNVFGKIILTDPVFFNEVGVQLFGKTVGLSRLVQPALHIEEIPRPDIVLLSHAHMDHMDLPTLERLTELYPGHILCLCATNTKDLIEDLAWKRVREIDWWETIYDGELGITAVEVLHNGWRLPWEPDRRDGRREGRSYNGYVISSRGKNLVFGGDTAFTEAFRELRSINIDCAFMPIGAYQGYTDNHCTPEQSVDLSMMMSAEAIAPIHCLTFRQSSEGYTEPMQRFLRYTQACGLRSPWTHIGDTHCLPGSVQALRP